MKIHPTLLGVALVLVATPVASQGSCSNSTDCPADTYCSSLSNTCVDIGVCSEVSECSDEGNNFAMALCLGTIFCKKGRCEIDCSIQPPTENDDPVEPVLLCETNDDCPSEGMGMFCASDGICERMGGCAEVSDCSNEGNFFPVAACMGYMTCNDRKCKQKCTGSDALFGCTTSSDCPESDMYCNSYEFCSKFGSCEQDEDCSNEDNSFMMATCVGRKYCDDGMCAIECGVSPEDPVQPIKPEGPTCSTSDDCPNDLDYCSTSGICRKPGSCIEVEDCALTDNVFPMVACVGRQYCEEGMCGIACGDFPEVPVEPIKPGGPTCSTSDDCPNDLDYCSTSGICRKPGSCIKVEDCALKDNVFPMIECVGQQYCDDGMCGMECGVFPEVPIDGQPFEEGQPVDERDQADNESPVDVEFTSCTSDSDCVTSSTTRSMEPKYCAQGVCMNHGSCLSDSDCVNPSNFIWSDKKCLGYLYCTSEGLCDRNCGEICKNGSKSVDCFANPCDTQPMCDEAASCVMDTCDGECSAVYFDKAGEVLDCSITRDINADASKVGDSTTDSKNIEVDDSGRDKNEAEPDTTTTNSNLDSSATRATSCFVLLATLLAAVIV